MEYQPLDDLHGSVVVITGVLGHIGSATAHRLAMRGARIIGITRKNTDLTQSQLNLLPNAHLEHLAMQADVNDCYQVKQAVNHVHDKVGQCNILINTIGQTVHVPHHDIEAMTDDLFEEVVRNNLRCYHTVIREFVSLMQQTPEGLIVNLGSIGAKTAGYSSNIAYAAAKAGLDALTRNLSRALAPGIRVMGVSPGVLDNDFVPGRPDAFISNVANHTPLKRVATAEDVAATIEGLTTLLRFMTGTVINVDGGTTLW